MNHHIVGEGYSDASARLADRRLDFSNKFLVLKDAPGGGTFATPADAVKAGAITWNYGNFITLMINFIIVAFCIFLVVRALNKMKRPAPTAAPVSKDCPACHDDDSDQGHALSALHDGILQSLIVAAPLRRALSSEG